MNVPRQRMRNMHRLHPCACCPTRMAVPGSPICTVCEAVTFDQAAATPAEETSR